MKKLGFDLIGFSEATPGAGGYVKVGLSERFYSLGSDADAIRIQRKAPYLAGLWTQGESSLSYIRLEQPSLKPHYYVTRVVNWDAYVDGSTTWYNPDLGFMKFFGRPMPLYVDEDLRVYVVNAADQDAIIGLMLTDQRWSKASFDRVNPTHIMRGTVDQTVTVNTWTSGTLTLAENLPIGDYAVVGMAVGAYDAGGDFMGTLLRLIFKGEYANAWRPGVACYPLIGDKTAQGSSLGWHDFHHFPLDQRMSFRYDQVPDVEILSPAAMDDFEVNLLLVKWR